MTTRLSWQVGEDNPGRSKISQIIRGLDSLSRCLLHRNGAEMRHALFHVLRWLAACSWLEVEGKGWQGYTWLHTRHRQRSDTCMLYIRQVL